MHTDYDITNWIKINLLASWSFFKAIAILNVVPTRLGTSMASTISSEDATSIHRLTTATFHVVRHKCRGLLNHTINQLGTYECWYTSKLVQISF